MMPHAIDRSRSPMSRNWILCFAAGLLVSASARAQTPCASCIDSITGQWHMLPALGIRAGVPQKLSAALGVVAGKNYRETGHTEDVAIYLEPGISAGRATLGYVSGFGNMGAGYGVGATALRTWKTPWMLRTNTTYVGGEAWLWPIFFSGPRVGVFREITGTKHGWFLTADFGFGL
jgi:hypothetical protein